MVMESPFGGHFSDPTQEERGGEGGEEFMKMQQPSMFATCELEKTQLDRKLSVYAI